MNDLTALPRREARGRGKVSIQYTDALTGRVLEEIRGENHVFTPQLTGTTGFQTTAMQVNKERSGRIRIRQKEINETDLRIFRAIDDIQ